MADLTETILIRDLRVEVQRSPRRKTIELVVERDAAVRLLSPGGEMFALKWSDVSMESRTVRLVSSKSAKNGKSAKVRYVPINENLWELFESMPAGAPTEWVFGRDINLRRKFKVALHWAGLPEYRVHDLRHTFASHLVMNGTPLYTVSKLLGHSSTEVTQRYAHLGNENLIQAVQSLKFGNGRK